MKLLISLGISIFIYFLGFSQPINKPTSQTTGFCDIEINDAFIQLNPHLEKDITKAKNQLEQEYQFALLNQAQRNSANNPKYVISVVFHILHENGPENISDEQVKDCIRVLNEDFLKQNADTIDVFPEFKSEIGFTNIEFRLALKDPDGNPTNGINRYFEPNLTNDAGENSKINQWDRSKYLNVWVVKNIASGAAGYTFFPSTLDSYEEGDGIILLSNYVGSIGTSSNNTSRTLTHEIGHWINLPHTWGFSNTPNASNNCNQDDGVYDTPNTKGNGSCNPGTNSCSSFDPHYGKDQIDNLQNYMDYSYCYKMFTKGQSTRMRTALESNIAKRRSLWQPSTLTETGVDQFLVADIEIENPIICFGDQAQFKDASRYGQNSWLWSFEGANINSSNAQNPVVSYFNPGIYDVELVASNSTKSLTVKKENFIWSLPEIGSPVPYQNGFEDPDNFSKDVYLINRDNDAIKFEKTNSYSLEGQNSLMLNNFSNTVNHKDEFIVGPVDVSPLSSIGISWDMAIANKTGNENEVLKVLVSADCGNTWKKVYQKSGSILPTSASTTNGFFPKNISDWRFEGTSNFSSAGPNNENFLIKFEFQSDGGNNLFIDNINVEGNYNPIAVLEYPRNGSINVSANPVINWKATSGIDQYEFEVDTSLNFNSPIKINGLKQYISVNPKNSDTEEQLSNLLLDQEYFWRVRTIAPDTTYNWSSVWSFKTSVNGVGDKELIASEDNIYVYPNPNKGEFFIQFNSNKNRTFEVYNSIGKLVLQSSTNNSNVQIDLTNNPRGIYFVKISDENSTSIKKVVLK